MKLTRGALRHFIDTEFNKKVADVGSAAFELIGDDIEEMSVEMNWDTETRKNILDETRTIDNGAEPSMEADPFYADTDSKLYKPLFNIAWEEKKGDDCKTLMLTVIVEDTSAQYHRAKVQEVMIKPNSYGGGTEGVNIPFTVTNDGAMVTGYVEGATLKDNPKFTAGEIPVSASLSGSTPVATSGSKSKNLTD